MNKTGGGLYRRKPAPPWLEMLANTMTKSGVEMGIDGAAADLEEGELDEAYKLTNTKKRRKTLWRRRASRKEKEIKEVAKERNAVYFALAASVIARNIAVSTKTIFLRGVPRYKRQNSFKGEKDCGKSGNDPSLETSEDSKVLLKMLKSMRLHMGRIRAEEKTLKVVIKLECKLAMIHTTLGYIRQEKRGIVNKYLFDSSVKME
ncbi:hypothetical protein OESDEN_08126 [Oesophagostomum dentatum]|uniref:Uncharacterized protein n=1 Tax=Oesophagostomum dentatum TaxID=61180 RepID=A0A0B1T9E4_OESDE|nr:hypothetical protein OESDEN_08126 [Oesophagostomum dentatum]